MKKSKNNIQLVQADRVKTEFAINVSLGNIKTAKVFSAKLVGGLETSVKANETTKKAFKRAWEEVQRQIDKQAETLDQYME